jgi:hypothetical protein
MKLNKLFEEITVSGAEFKCNNCNFKEQIDKTKMLYQYEVNQNKLNIKDLEENELTCRNPILPRTHDYICKNISCPTNTKNKTKEAVFYRNNDNYKVNYICCVCYYG